MSTEKSNVPQIANTRLTKAVLDEPKTLIEMMNLPAIEERWVGTYEKLSGRPDGGLRFEAEKVLFSQAIATNKDFEKCDRFSVYSSFIELAVSGLSLREGMAYIIPYGAKAQFQPGWKGRLEQITEMSNVVHVQQPKVVYEGDTFDFEQGMRTTIHKHIPQKDRPRGAKILYTYLVIQFTHGLEVYMMDREEVLSIRDQYSESFKSYAKALGQEQNKGKKFGDFLTIKFKKDNVWKEFESKELPMWVGDEAQAFKKTLVKRTYNELPKLPKHKALDEKLNNFYKENPDAIAKDPDDGLKTEDLNIDEIINSTLENGEEVSVNTKTGEVQKEDDSIPFEEIKDDKKTDSVTETLSDDEIPAEGF